MRFDEFLKEREYLLGVSKKTLTYYPCAFNSWNKHATDGTVLTWIAGMKTAGISNKFVEPSSHAGLGKV